MVGKQWMWKIQHGTGQREINELHIPVNRKIRLTMTTEDVLHDFFIPAFRTKADVVPGRYTNMWLKRQSPENTGCSARILRPEPLRNGRLGICDGAEGLRQLAFQALCDQTPVQAGEDLFRQNSAALRATPAVRTSAGRCSKAYSTRKLVVGGQTVVADRGLHKKFHPNPAGRSWRVISRSCRHSRVRCQKSSWWRSSLHQIPQRRHQRTTPGPVAPKSADSGQHGAGRNSGRRISSYGKR